jgi:dephospho-CoA kinase
LTVGALRLGLTGGIGSGKSTVAALLHSHGASVIDADAISRGTTATGGAAIGALENAFGPGIVDADGAMDRTAMRTLVFADPQAKLKLEGIVHPLVGQAIAQQAQAAQDAGARCIVFDIPLLVESGHWRKQLDRVLVVDCLESTQISRVVARSGLETTEVEKIILAQAPRKRRLAAADVVLFNDGIGLDELAAEAALIAQQFGL